MTDFETIIGYTPGVIGRIAELHALYYSKEWGFDHFFEGKVSTELSAFISRYNQSLDRIWSIQKASSIEGSITIDNSSEKPGIAHLRWFIVSDKMKGTGAGNHLMKQAIDFCNDMRFKKVYLWTFQGLESAKHLYQKFGFKLVEELEGSQWGTTVKEQRYELVIT